MQPNIPIERVPRIPADQLGMYSLASDVEQKPPNEETIKAISDLQRQVSDTLSPLPPSIEQLEKKMELGKYAPQTPPRFLDRVLFWKKPATFQEDLTFEERRIRVLDTLLSQNNDHLRLMAVPLLRELSEPERQRFYPEIVNLSQANRWIRSRQDEDTAIDILMMLNKSDRTALIDQHITNSSLNKLPPLKRVIPLLDTDSQQHHILNLIDDFYLGNVALGMELIHTAPDEVKVNVIRDALELVGTSQALNISHVYQMIQAWDAEAQNSLIEDVLEKLEDLKLIPTENDHVEQALYELSYLSPQMQRAVITSTYDKLPVDNLGRIKGDFFGHLSNLDKDVRDEMLVRMLDVTSHLHLRQILTSEITHLRPPAGADLTRTLLESDGPECLDAAIYAMAHLDENEFLEFIEPTMLRIQTSLKEDPNAYFRIPIHKLNSSVQALIADRLMSSGDSGLILAGIRVASNLEDADKRILATKHAEILLSHLSNDVDGSFRDSGLYLLRHVAPEQFPEAKQLIISHLDSLLNSESQFDRYRAVCIIEELPENYHQFQDYDPIQIIRDQLSIGDSSEDILICRQIANMSSEIQLSLAKEITGVVQTNLDGTGIYNGKKLLDIADQLTPELQREIQEVIAKEVMSYKGPANGYFESLALRILPTLDVDERVRLLEKMPLSPFRLADDESLKNAIMDLPGSHQTQFIEAHLRSGTLQTIETGIEMLNALDYEFALPIVTRIQQDSDLHPNSDMAYTIKALASESLHRFSAEVKSGERANVLERIPSPTQSILHELAHPEREIEMYKTGSTTTILPAGQEASVRKISSNSAHVWLNAYLSADTWKDAGFDYIPIEPILAMENTGSNDVEVTTLNLRGRALVDSQEFLVLYSPEILEEVQSSIDTISTTLDEMGIVHGHLHHGNFVIVPKTDDGNNIDFTEPPRVYAIDFDAARFMHNAPRLNPSNSSAPDFGH